MLLLFIIGNDAVHAVLEAAGVWMHPDTGIALDNRLYTEMVLPQVLLANHQGTYLYTGLNKLRIRFVSVNQYVDAEPPVHDGWRQGCVVSDTCFIHEAAMLEFVG